MAQSAYHGVSLVTVIVFLKGVFVELVVTMIVILKSRCCIDVDDERCWAALNCERWSLAGAAAAY